jgi:hypothetical protein
MLDNIDEIVTDCRSLLDEPSTNENKFYSDTEIIRWANEGSDVFTSLTRVLCHYYAFTITEVSIHDSREIRVGSDFINFDEGGILYNDKPLREVSLMELDEWYGKSWRDHTGNAALFYRRGEYIGIYPKPVAGDTLKYYGISRTPTMVASDGVAPLSDDYRLVAFRRFIRDYAMALCYWKKGDRNGYREKMNDFEKGIALVNSVVHGERNQPKRMIPSRRYGSAHTINALDL